MEKLKPVKVNLSTKSADVLATIREEQPKAWYYFRKKYGSKLNNKQKRMCEPVDMLYELTKDGMFIKDVALNTAFYQDYTEEEAAKEGIKKLAAIKKLGMEKHMVMMAAIHMSFVRILEDILHIKLDMKQQAVISHVVGECGKDLVAKWVGQDAISPEKDNEFQDDLIEVMVKCAKKLKLRFVNRESITKRMNEIREEANQENKESN